MKYYSMFKYHIIAFISLVVISYIVITLQFENAMIKNNFVILQNIKDYYSTFTVQESPIYSTIVRNNSELDIIYAHVIKSLEKRRQIIKKYCDNNPKEKKFHYEVMRRLIMDRNNKITWCPICKAGSTVWMKVFAKVGGEMTPDTILPNSMQVNKLARRAFPYLGIQTVYENLNKTTKFLIVRHPFERLLSAFRDKLEDINKPFYYKKFGLHIIKWYRRDPSEKKKYPTFKEFLLYILNEKSFDEHWKPYHLECAPCFMNYDVIIKIETFDRDHEYFMKYLGIQYIEAIFKQNNRENTNHMGTTDEKIIIQYFKQIPTDLLKSIYKIYRKDFELFGYSPDKYYNWTDA